MRLLDPEDGFWKCLICKTLALHQMPEMLDLVAYFDVMIEEFGIREDLVPRMMRYLCHSPDYELAPVFDDDDDAAEAAPELVETHGQLANLIDLSDGEYVS